MIIDKLITVEICHLQGVVEFVASGSRFRVYIPRETCVITFLLSGVSCPRYNILSIKTFLYFLSLSNVDNIRL